MFGWGRSPKSADGGFRANDAGTRVVQYLHKQLMIDAEWTVWEQRGFTWWGCSQAQRIWSDPGRESMGVTIYRVTVETDFCSYGNARTAYQAINFPFYAMLQGFASLSGLVIDDASGIVKYRLAVHVHDQNEMAMRGLLSHGTIMQAVDAHSFGDRLAEITGGKPAHSSHPTSGLRTKIDDIYAVVDGLIRPAGQQPSRWLGGAAEFASTVDLLNRAPLFRQRKGFASAGPDGLTAEVGIGAHPGSAAVGGQSALIQATAGEVHSQLGAGLQLRLTLPIQPTGDTPGRTGYVLAKIERETQNDLNGIGSWCIAPRTGLLTHVSFVPNYAHQASLLLNLTMGLSIRAMWADTLLRTPPPELRTCEWTEL